MKFKLLLLAAFSIAISSYSMHAMKERDSDGPREGNHDDITEKVELFDETNNPTLGDMIRKVLYNNKLLVTGICTTALLAMRKYNSKKDFIKNLPLIKNGAHEAAIVSAVSYGTKLLSLTFIINEILNYKPKRHFDEQLDDLTKKLLAMSLVSGPSFIMIKGKVQKDTAKYLTIALMPKKFLRFVIKYLPKTKAKLANQINAIATESGQAAALLSAIILYKLTLKLPGRMQALYLKSTDLGKEIILDLL